MDRLTRCTDCRHLRSDYEHKSSCKKKGDPQIIYVRGSIHTWGIIHITVSSKCPIAERMPSETVASLLDRMVIHDDRGGAQFVDKSLWVTEYIKNRNDPTAVFQVKAGVI